MCSSDLASLQLPTLPVGNYSITAVYAGSTLFSGSTSAAVNVTIVQPAAPGFTIAAAQTTLSVTGGQSVSTSLTITPLNGFNQPLALQCSGLPSGASCVFGTPMVLANGTSTIAVTISTATLSAILQNQVDDATTICLMFPFMGLFSAKRRKAHSRTLRAGTVAVLMTFSAGAMTGCGASGAAAASGSTPAPPAPQTSTVMITATAQGGAVISHTTQIVLTVN